MSAPFTWQHRVDAALAVAEQRRPAPMGAPRITFRSPAAAYIRDAAAARGLTPSSFARRATLALTAEVLGVELAELCAIDPTIQRIGYSPAADPTGRIGGPWQIIALKEPMI